MKTFISFLIAAAIIGVVLFVILYWVVKMEFIVALLTSISGAFAGFVVDYVRERKKNNIIKQ